MTTPTTRYQLVDQNGITLTRTDEKSKWADGKVHDTVYDRVMNKVIDLCVDEHGTLNNEFVTVENHTLKLVAVAQEAPSSAASATKAADTKAVSKFSPKNPQCQKYTAATVAVMAIVIGTGYFFFPEQSASCLESITSQFS